MSLSSSVFGRNKGRYPDFGVTEFLSGTKNSNQITNPDTLKKNRAVNTDLNDYERQQLRQGGYGKVAGASISAPSNYKNTGSLYGGKTTKTKAIKTIDQQKKKADEQARRQRQMEIEAVNASFNDEQNRLSELDQQVRNQYDSANAEYDKYLPQFQGQVASERATQQGALDNTELQRKQESNQAMGQVRQALAELQRRQNALLGATGGFNSSAAPAAGETLSRQAFQGLSDVQTQRQNALNQIQTERAKVNDFYNSKLIEGEQKIQQAKTYLQQQFMSQLDAIAQAKGQSAAAKRQATIEAWSNYTNTSNQLNQQLLQNKINLDQWAAQMDASLQQTAGGQNVLGDVASVGFEGMDTSLGAEQTGGTQEIGYNTGTYDPDEYALNVGAYDANQGVYDMSGQYVPNQINGISVPSVVQRRLKQIYA